jgi:NADPH2 dehydrogenase
MLLLFSPSSIGSLRLANRLIMSPMQTYRGDADEYASEYHAQHNARPARAGAGLIMVESTAVSIERPLFVDDIGIYEDGHIPMLELLVGAVHAENTPVGI